MVNAYYYNGNLYQPRTSDDVSNAATKAMLASSAIMSTLPLAGVPFEKQLSKEHAQNSLYKKAFYDSLNISGLDKKGVRIVPMEFSPIVNDYSLGKNASYTPKNRIVQINTNRISIAGFHELGHAMNDINGKFGKVLSKVRWPGRIAAGWLGTIALFSRSKPKEAQRNPFDYIKDNCGKLAFLCMVPTVIEEALASHKGLKLARKTGLTEPLIKNMKKLYGKALLTYAAHAVITGFAVGTANMIMEKNTRPKKLNYDEGLYDLFR